jgi:ribose 5-phosphate isomerase B
MKIYIGADHDGFDLKQTLSDYLSRGGHEIVDKGDTEKHPDDDYPVFAAQVVHGMSEDPSTNIRGILISGGGQGMAIAANRHKGVRACLGWNQDTVRMSRNDNDSNVLCIPARDLNFETVVGIVHTWLITPFAGAPRYKRRIELLDQLGN